VPNESAEASGRPYASHGGSGAGAPRGSGVRPQEPLCLTWDENGLAVWTLRIGKQEIPSRWVIVDREFRLVK
jgi:hypothetical protein